MVAAHPARSLPQRASAVSGNVGRPARVAPNTLSARLKALERDGVVGTRLYESHPPRYEYFLTEKGKALGPVLKAIHNWGERYG